MCRSCMSCKCISMGVSEWKIQSGNSCQAAGFSDTTEICQSQSDCSIREIEFLTVNSYFLGIITSRPTRKLNRQYCHLCLRQAMKGFVERHDVFVGLPTGSLLLVTVLLPTSSFLYRDCYGIFYSPHTFRNSVLTFTNNFMALYM